MKIDNNELLESILKNIHNIDYIRTESIPNIPLYMDQVTTFMDTHLSSGKRYEDDKVLTKTMINNYAKNNLLPPPDKKKYNKEHIVTLSFIYYLKNILSIKDIQTLMDPLTEKYFNSNSMDLTKLYEELLEMERNKITDMETDIKASYDISREMFSHAPEKEQEFLQLFSFICSLCFDIYLKKQIVEALIDSIDTSNSYPQKKTTKKK